MNGVCVICKNPPCVMKLFDGGTKDNFFMSFFSHFYEDLFFFFLFFLTFFWVGTIFFLLWLGKKIMNVKDKGVEVKISPKLRMEFWL